MKASTRERLRRKRDAYRADYGLFARECLGVAPWEADGITSQADVLRAASTARTMAVRSGHKVGKTRTAAIVALAEYVLWPGSRTILTAPTARQVREMVWREVRTLYRNAPMPLGGILHKSMDAGLVMPERDTQVIGMSTDDADRFSGFSAPRLTYFVDEAPGVDAAVFEAIEGNRAGGARLIMTGNPTQSVGTFYDYFHKYRGLCERFHIDSEAVARAIEEGSLGHLRGTGLATVAWVEDFITKFGRESREFAVRVRGDFAGTSSDGAIAPAVVDAALAAWLPECPAHLAREPLVAALDVARFGDDASVLYFRRGNYVFKPMRWRGLDSKQLALVAVAAVNSMRYPSEGRFTGSARPKLFVDASGVGAGVYDEIRDRYKSDVDAVALDFGSKSSDPRSYANLRAELWREANHHIASAMLPPAEYLREDLCAPRYKYNRANQAVIEKKEDIKKRLGRSPDDGDACIMLWAKGATFSSKPVNVGWIGA